jgi:hypothetical protein
MIMSISSFLLSHEELSKIYQSMVVMEGAYGSDGGSMET